MQIATFAAGCFWGVEETFRQLRGVLKTQVGYTGGKTKDPTYEDVCSGMTGHAEAVQLEFDPNAISYKELLKEFWSSHNPMSLNRQGPDVGTQYRSAVFYHDESQKQTAQEFKKILQESGKYPHEIVTEISSIDVFYRAEEYHQQYFFKQGGGSCH